MDKNYTKISTIYRTFNYQNTETSKELKKEISYKKKCHHWKILWLVKYQNIFKKDQNRGFVWFTKTVTGN